MGENSVPSSQPSSANATNASSGGGSPFAAAAAASCSAAPTAAGASGAAGAATGAASGVGAFSRSAVRPRTPPHSQQPALPRPQQPGGPNCVAAVANSASDRSKLAGVQDLIHLEPAIYEDDVMRTLQARFFHQKYFVSGESFSINLAFQFVLAWDSNASKVNGSLLALLPLHIYLT